MVFVDLPMEYQRTPLQFDVSSLSAGRFLISIARSLRRSNPFSPLGESGRWGTKWNAR